MPGERLREVELDVRSRSRAGHEGKTDNEKACPQRFDTPAGGFEHACCSQTRPYRRSPDAALGKRGSEHYRPGESRIDRLSASCERPRGVRRKTTRGHGIPRHQGDGGQVEQG